MRQQSITTIGKYTLVLTCGACPEQYDVYDNPFDIHGKEEIKSVAYLRLRHGRFRADVPSCGGDTVYEAWPKGDGAFDDDEREQYLNEAITAIDQFISGAFK